MSAMIPAPIPIIAASACDGLALTRYVPMATVLADPAAWTQRKSTNNQ